MAQAFAQSPEIQSGSLSYIDLNWTSDSGGAVSSPVTNLNGFLAQVEIDPGTAAPSANYTATLVDASGFDIFAGLAALGNLSATVTTRFSPMVTSSDGTTAGTFPAIASGDHTLTIASAGSGKSGRIRLWLRK